MGGVDKLWISNSKRGVDKLWISNSTREQFKHNVKQLEIVKTLHCRVMFFVELYKVGYSLKMMKYGRIYNENSATFRQCEINSSG